MREKFNTISELQKRSTELDKTGKLSIVGNGDFPGANNVARATMNIKHHTQSLTINNPEFPMIFDGKENLIGKHSSFYYKTDKDYKVINVIKKYDELLNGKSNIALYFLHNKSENSYKLVERNEVENLTENFGFTYKNDYLDNCEIGDVIPADTIITSSTSYDEYGNVGVGVHGRIAYGIDPSVQDDAIYCSESFAKKAVHDEVTSKTIPINDASLLLNLYGDDKTYKGMPNIGEMVTNGILVAVRGIKEGRMFSELRDSSLRSINEQSDSIYYGNGEIIDINVYCNNPNMQTNKVTAQLIQYYNDARWFYTEVYRQCKTIISMPGAKVDKEINRWQRKAMDYLDTKAVWAFNENVFSNIMLEIVLRERVDIKVGRKITGRHGNKTVVCNILPDNEMPFMTREVTIDEYGVTHPKGVVERVDLVTNPLAIINRTIPMALYEASISFIIDITRKHAASLGSIDEKKDFIFDIISIINPRQGVEIRKLYDNLSDSSKRRFVNETIALNDDGTLKTNRGLYIRWEAFSDTIKLRDAIIEIYEKYGDIIVPYHVFTPKPKWGRDIYIGQANIGYQYTMVLKQSGERGFSVRSAGSISDESLPEKGNENKVSKLWHSSTPIRFGEYETPNFMIITNPEDFALVTALYRSSRDGRQFMYEAILNEDGNYDIPDSFTSRSAEVLQVYLKSLGIKIETIIDDSEYIGVEGDDDSVIGYKFKNATIFATRTEYYYLKKLQKIYKRYLKENPSKLDDVDDVWDYIYSHLTFKKKYITDNIYNLFSDNMQNIG